MCRAYVSTRRQSSIEKVPKTLEINYSTDMSRGAGSAAVNDNSFF
jgi:hypothetical protein